MSDVAKSWHSMPAPFGWSKGDSDCRLVFCPRSKRPAFVRTRERGQRLPRETSGKRWRVWTCACGAKRSIVAWKNSRGRRLYALEDLDWAKKHHGCAGAK